MMFLRAKVQWQIMLHGFRKERGKHAQKMRFVRQPIQETGAAHRAKGPYNRGPRPAEIPHMFRSDSDAHKFLRKINHLIIK